MKHIGIVACSAEGAALSYQTICREALTLVGRHDHPRITLDTIPMARWLSAFDAEDYASVAGFMLESARLLAAAGADFAICPDLRPPRLGPRPGEPVHVLTTPFDVSIRDEIAWVEYRRGQEELWLADLGGS